MARLRDLLGFNTADEIQGSSGPIEGSQFVFSTTCHNNEMNEFHNNCCVSFVTPAGIECATFEVWGGGGGGSGMCAADSYELCYMQPPGTAGAYVVRCLDNVSEGDRYCMIVGTSTSCSENYCGRRGCFSCLNGPSASLCAQGGYGGPCIRSWGCGFCCNSATANAFGGDYNIDGLYSGICVTCTTSTNYDYNHQVIPYPGGLNNLCGGWVQTQQRECDGSWHCNYDTACCIARMIPGIGSTNMCNFGYVPGIPAASFSGSCNGEDCTCGGPGGPGMIRVTYK